MDLIIRTVEETWAVMGEMAPYLIFGFLAAGILSVLIRAETVERHLGENSFLSVFKAALFGVPLPLCSCGVIPVTASLKNSGASRGASTAFLLSTPQTGVDSILVTYGLLGPVFAVFRPAAALVSGVIGGLLVNAFDPEDPGPDGHAEPAGGASGREIPSSFPGKVKAALRYAFYSLPRSLGKPLLAGLFVAGLLTALVPDHFFSGFLGEGFLPMLAMMAVGIPVYVCSTASVPIAAALMAKGVSPGAALVFLMTGPATNAAALAMVWKVMGKRTTVLFLVVTALSALVSGLVLDYIWSQGTLLGMPANTEVHEMMSSSVKTLSAIVLIAMLSFAFFGACGKPKDSSPEPTTEVVGGPIELTTINLSIGGMTCEHCQNTVTRALEECPGVRSAAVDLESRKAVVKGAEMDTEALVTAVAKRGYTAEVIE
jgi:uncharacterized membrane protein YraQ (UPF0718 family)/copper chaperone CopZ